MHVGFCETDQHKIIVDNVKAAIMHGKLIAVTGLVGSGKTTLLRHIRRTLESEGDVIVSVSYALEKDLVDLKTFMTALYLDLSKHVGLNKSVTIPPDQKERARKLKELIETSKKPVVLFVDDAHDIRGKVIFELKQLMDTINESLLVGVLSIVLAGLPKLKTPLNRLPLKESGPGTEMITLD